MKIVDGGEPATQRQRTRVEQFLDAMKHPWRRHLLYYLQDEGSVAIDDAPRILQQIAHDEGVDRKRRIDPDAARAELHHNHIPRLVGSGLIEYDERRGMISSCELSTDIAPIFELIRDYERR